MEFLRIKSHCSVISCSGGSGPDLQIWGGGHPDPDIRGGEAGLITKTFRHFWPQFGLKIRGGPGPPGPSPGSHAVVTYRGKLFSSRIQVV